MLDVPGPSLASQLPQVYKVITSYVATEDPCGSWLASDEARAFGIKSKAFVEMNNKRQPPLCSGQASMRMPTGSMRGIGTGEFA